MRFPYVHDLARLLDLLVQAGQDVPKSIRRAAGLSVYAVETRYPGLSEPVTQQEFEEAMIIAEEVIHWAQDIIGGEQRVDPNN